MGSESGTSAVALNSFVHLQMTSSGHHKDLDLNYEGFKSIIFVIDILSDYVSAMSELCDLIERLRSRGLRPDVAVLMHKCDGLTVKERQTIYQEIKRQVMEEIDEMPSDLSPIQVEFYLTSLYDHSILHAISRVVQRNLDTNPRLTKILDDFCQSHGLQQAFLFDLVSKIYIASDSSRTKPIYLICATMPSMLSRTLPSSTIPLVPR